MKFNRLSAFTLGVIITAASVGAVTYVNAASNATLKACANKTTGAMRYISKGSCKKTEKALSWNQMGPQGLAGSVGAAGTNGQNFHVIDAVGRDLGVAIGLWNSGKNATIIFEGGLWEVVSYSNFINGGLSDSSFYSDSSCTTSLALVDEKQQSMARGWNGSTTAPKYWKSTGDSFLLTSKIVYGKVRSGSNPNYVYTCLPSDSTSFRDDFLVEGDYFRLSAVTEVTPPAYTAPFTIVAK
jgi:hypothetical protein